MLRVVWELRNGPIGFRALMVECAGVSAAVLRERLLELLDANVATQNAERQYYLTPFGLSLFEALTPLENWSRQWAKSLK